ncbi:MAG: primosomal protein N' [Tetragenococcus halophilus]|uniref:Replication restart protein PriA n=1 Tax=Tetragenococcus halophilus TaxID=51669 RepID=A0AB37D3I1_TETHA|nr:primosomal protein N' [Tetragenococcus halophilus]MCO8290838.1 primosomal protein N' [Tetragenococcus halophilus]MCO8295044.1 primosomal protein N' [Tetragenococcus halophilus]MDN5830458.1 primosomal protein N' [Tetragenococcus halophilus]MDN6141216.1 primosomal protein N' [Tetragenococcus halophilus]MDN6143102.1 primosomal protein N' [Tetragenococcus halophilus]
MPLFAEVIVDVPTMQTDQPFTYIVPDELLDVIEIGMRVEVPFGDGNRHIQGFVTALSQTSTYEEKLKPIIRMLDLSPVLNQELLALADYMKETTYAFKITCLQTMLPSVMKAEYQKKIVLKDPSHPVKQQYFLESDEIDWQEAEEMGILHQLKKLREENIVELRYVVKKKNKVKKIRYVNSLLTQRNAAGIYQEIDNRAPRQKQLVELLENNAHQPTAFFTKQGISAAVLKQGEKKGWLSFEEVEAYRDPHQGKVFNKTSALSLNNEQQQAVDKILAAEKQAKNEVFLLEGITGSGKTEVYLQSISTVLAEGKTAIMLVPEIALTPQMVERFKSRLGDAVAVLHSGLSQGERYDEWRKIERGEAQVVVGARSAIFAPLENIGIIIVDEEHESSYKQDEAPRYHARDLAIWRGKYHHCPVVLGSATPSLESRARAQKDIYHLLLLSKRADPAANLPSIEIVDLKKEYERKNMSNFSKELQTKIADRLEKKEQSVLMLNRRGYSSFVMCRDCGYVLPCPNCDISLTLHMDTKTMRCHYCGHEEGIPKHCPECGSNKIRYYGTGTQKVQEELQELFPSARILRMDVDTTRRKGAHERILQKFGAQEADILLGTQMIAKGLDYPNITLVGVLNADTALNLPDFRSNERTFQLLTQVAGRAGRAEKAGEVIIQSFNPDHHAIVLAQKQDYETFYKQEMFLRHQSGYSPYYFTVKITCSHQEEQIAAKKMFQIAQEVKTALSSDSIILGPTPASIARVKNRYQYQMIIKYKKEPALSQMLKKILDNSQKDQRKSLYVAIDNEPVNFI